MNFMDEGTRALLLLRFSSSDILVRMTDEEETAPALQVNFHEQRKLHTKSFTFVSASSESEFR